MNQQVASLSEIIKPAFIGEVNLALLTLALLVAAVIKGDKSSNLVAILAAVILGGIMVLTNYKADAAILSSAENFLLVIKNFICFFAIACLLLFIGHSKYNSKNVRAEYPVIMLFSVLGMMLMISATDFLIFYLGLELQSFALYILAAINRDNEKASEAGMKYFVLGSLSSGLILFGISLIYGFSGSIFFSDVAHNIQIIEEFAVSNFVLLLGMVLVITGLLFKVSAVPFHMWTPDVYEGAPTPVTVFLSSVPKIAGFIIFFRILYEPFASLYDSWRGIIYITVIASMFIGALGAINQTNFKRLLAYSTINHVGFLLITLLVANQEAVSAMLLYLVIYSVMTIGAFAFLMSLKQRHAVADTLDKKLVEDISAFSGIARKLPYTAFAITILMVSMAGLPPFAGFFAKFFIFKVAISNGMIDLAIIAAVVTVISCYYYLRIIKIVYLDEPQENYNKKVTLPTKIVLIVAVLFNLLFFIKPNVLIEYINNSAKLLF